MKTKAALALAEVVNVLTLAGWVADGTTAAETVRVPTTDSPVFGGIGGELRTFGGRERFAKGERRVTVGKRTVFFYTPIKGGLVDGKQFGTSDLNGIQKEAMR